MTELIVSARAARIGLAPNAAVVAEPTHHSVGKDASRTLATEAV
ncbi:hypothetical protein SAMN04487926_104105 [Paraburkholderia steynii]|uniref:Uncharacterized protein n=1 Tax=Paraburkholderia steynii TaxID=1245441 RepID=A0A7Z7B345_9BURK|nr:hypothetical protein [Paraburkholderia steynii]SDH36019.1 hypothetical protein SAMN04487926_104105 [Paraburkholderia steynii]